MTRRIVITGLLALTAVAGCSSGTRNGTPAATVTSTPPAAAAASATPAVASLALPPPLLGAGYSRQDPDGSPLTLPGLLPGSISVLDKATVVPTSGASQTSTSYVIFQPKGDILDAIYTGTDDLTLAKSQAITASAAIRAKLQGS